MPLLNIFSRGKEEANQRYVQIRNKIFEKARNQSHQHKIEITSESAKIGEMCGILRKREFQEYKDIATWLLASYESELAFYIIREFDQFAGSLGYVPIGKIMLAIEHIDHIASGIMVRTSLLNENPTLFEYMNKSPMRTAKAIETLTTAVCSLTDIGDGRETYGVLTVPEMKQGVKDKLYSLDEVVAKYITK